MYFMKSRYIAAFAAIQMLISSFLFYKRGHWAYIPPMISMAMFCLFMIYIDLKRDKKNES